MSSIHPLRRSLRTVVALCLAGCVLVGLPALAVAADAEETPAETASAVQITFTPAENDEPCRPPVLGLSRSVENVAEHFTVRITVAAALCSRVDAAAVVYAMPGNGVAWPQQLVERVDFELREPGVTEIRFDKGCEPLQFDLITGASPATISPVGPWHGPLLFAFDTATTLQYWGRTGCDTTTTTVAPTTTEAPTTTGAPTTEAPTTEAPTTTVAPTTTDDVPVEVLPTVATPPDTPGPQVAEVGGATVATAGDSPVQVAGTTQSRPAPSGLALTGSSSFLVGGAGILLVLVGGMILLGNRRRAL